MRLPGYYTSGQFAKMAHVSVRTIRFYDKQNILKPSFVNEAGARFYSDDDFVKLQQILLFKYLGFSLDEIKGLTIQDPDFSFIQNSLNMQLKLVRDRIEQMQLVEHAIAHTAKELEAGNTPDWNQMLNLIHLTNMETSLKTQYQDASNISSRIRLHKLYSQNSKRWFPWLFEQLFPHKNFTFSTSKPIRILEIGCGNGSFWTENKEQIPELAQIVLSDISAGMIRDARRAIGSDDLRFTFEQIDCQDIPYDNATFDYVIANHVLFYSEQIEQALTEIHRVLVPGGTLMCSTYGPLHMAEISQLVTKFDNRIVLAAENLYERFGSDNGKKMLNAHFSDIMYAKYEDSLNVTNADHLIEYILSCHGNQNQYLLDRYKDFRIFVEKQTRNGFFITKDAGAFICKKSLKVT